MNFIELKKEHFSHEAKEMYATIQHEHICSFDIRCNGLAFINTPSSFYSLSAAGAKYVVKQLNLNYEL